MYQFQGPIVRPQTEWDSVFIEVTIGCTYDGCTFCNFYKDTPFGVVSMDLVEQQMMEESFRHPHAKKVWLSGGNPFALSYSKLMELAKMTRDYFPHAHVTTYARVDDLNRKTADQIRDIKEAGIDDVVVGVESADPVVLRDVNKGYTQDDIIDAFTKLDEAGIAWRVIYLGGLAGRGKLEESARTTAAVLNRFHPFYMYLTTVAVLPDTPLADEAKRGEWQEATELERIKEFRALIDALKNPIGVYANTSANSVSFVADLPRDKRQTLRELDRVIAGWSDRDERLLQRRRHEMTSV